MSGEFHDSGSNEAALFNLKLHRGDGMALVAMNWKDGEPPEDFVGFAIEHKEPGSDRFKSVRNRLAFPMPDGAVNPTTLSSRLSPIQKFRWVHFPFNAELLGEFVYKVTPVFMDESEVLSYGESQQARIELARETHPGQLNVTFTRGFVSSQAFVDKYGGKTPKETQDLLSQLLPAKADEGLDFEPSHTKAEAALKWMGFEARSAILEVLDEAIKDESAKVCAVLYDLNEPGIVSRLEQLAERLRIIIDDDGAHGKPDSGETMAAARLVKSAGKDNVKRQHMGKLQHNKTIVVDGKVQAAVCGSTNHSWRGFFVQNNNAIVLRGEKPVKLFQDAFEDYWKNDKVAEFGKTGSAKWNNLGLDGIDAQIGFSPRAEENAVLQTIADDIASTESSLFFSLAFLYQTPGAIQDAVKKVQEDDTVFCYGISDHQVKGFKEFEEPEAEGVDLLKPDGSVTVVSPSALTEKNTPEPFKSEPTGGGGTRMHHKFIVIDFDKPTARVYMGSYNFSKAADLSNGENLLLIRDQRVAVSYTVEALRIFDHCEFRLAQADAERSVKKLMLARPPRNDGDEAWWSEDFTDARKIRDRELFA
jgi:phosphatidylserine/phosphatidylglycerophosphate/cardiolipin synthase-like enzyme